jgi:hypothetical protein
MPAGGSCRWLCRALAGCVLAVACAATAQAAAPAALTQYGNGSDSWATTGAVPSTYGRLATFAGSERAHG